MDWVDRPQNYKDLYEILQRLQGSHLDKDLQLKELMYVSLRWSVVLSARAQIQMDQSELRMKPPCERPLFPARSQASVESRRGVNFKAKFSFFISLSAAETHVFGVKFIGLYGTVVFIAIRYFSF